MFRGEAAAEAAGEGESGATGHLKGPSSTRVSSLRRGGCPHVVHVGGPLFAGEDARATRPVWDISEPPMWYSALKSTWRLQIDE